MQVKARTGQDASTRFDDCKASTDVRSKPLSKPERSMCKKKVQGQDKGKLEQAITVESGQGKARYSQTASQDKKSDRKGVQGCHCTEDGKRESQFPVHDLFPVIVDGHVVKGPCGCKWESGAIGHGHPDLNDSLDVLQSRGHIWK